MRIFYYFSSYISHLTAGLDYARCLKKLGHEVSSNLPEQDLARCLGDAAPAISGSFPPAAPGVSASASLGASAPSPSSAMPLPEPPPDSALSAAQLKAAREADLFILHDDPLAHDQVYAALPFLHDLKVVTYTAWENEMLSPLYVRPLQRVGRVWTCSDFSREAIAPHVPYCAVLPHLVERKNPSREDLAWAGQLLNSLLHPDSRSSSECFGPVLSGPEHFAPRPFVFLSVVDAINPRKNLRGLLTAYGLLRKMTSRPVRLLLKQYRVDMELESIEGVSSIGGKLSEGRMRALYASCDAYVSAHHSEGWGLGLSSAMAFGKPVIATGYSGNMQFMNAGNSLPVPYSLVPVSREMCELVPLFTPAMRWAEPDLAAMAKTMHRAVEGRLPPELPGAAASVVRAFGPKSIMARLEELLAELV